MDIQLYVINKHTLVGKRGEPHGKTEITELKVMQAVWHIDPPASTSAVREELQKERPWNLSALQTLLGRLVRRGFLQTEKQGKSRYYTPLVTEEDYLAEDSRRYFQKWTGGSLRDLVACLYVNHSVTKEDLEELKAFIEDETEG